MGLIKRILAVFFVFVFAAGLFGCSKIGAPATTEELLVRYVANENVGNFDAKVNVDLSVNALGVRAVVPVKADLRVANNVAHGTIEVDLSSLNTRNYTMEIYAELLDDAINCYIGTPSDAGTAWKLWKINMSSKIDIFTVTDLLSSSELTLIAKDSDPEVCYELATPTTKVLETAFGVAADPAKVGGMGEQDMINAVSNDKVRVGFTNDCLLQSVDTSALFTLKSSETNNVQVRVGIGVAATLSDYGKIDPAEIAIPNEVRQKAVETQEPVDVLEIIGADSPLAGAVGKPANT